MHRSADLPALNGRLANALVTRDQQQHPIAARDRLFQPTIDRAPGGVEIHPVKIEDPVGLDIARSQPPVPAPIQRHPMVM